MADIFIAYEAEVEVTCRGFRTFYSNASSILAILPQVSKTAITPLVVTSLNPFSAITGTNWRPAVTIREQVRAQGMLEPLDVECFYFSQGGASVPLGSNADGAITCEAYKDAAFVGDDLVFNYSFSFRIDAESYAKDCSFAFEMCEQMIEDQYGPQKSTYLTPSSAYDVIIPRREYATIFGRFRVADFECIVSIPFPVFNQGGTRAATLTGKVHAEAVPIFPTMNLVRETIQSHFQSLRAGGVMYLDASNALSLTNTITDKSSKLLKDVVSVQVKSEWLSIGIKNHSAYLGVVGNIAGWGATLLDLGGRTVEVYMRRIAGVKTESELDIALTKCLKTIDAQSSLRDRCALSLQYIACAICALMKIDAQAALERTKHLRESALLRDFAWDQAIDSLMGLPLSLVMGLIAAGALTGGAAIVVAACAAAPIGLKLFADFTNISDSGKQKADVIALKIEDLSLQNSIAMKHDKQTPKRIFEMRTLLFALYQRKPIATDKTIALILNDGEVRRSPEVTSLKLALYQAESGVVGSYSTVHESVSASANGGYHRK